MKFKKYVSGHDKYIEMYEVKYGKANKVDLDKVSVSKYDSEHGSPKIGDMVARDPDNHEDMWLVSQRIFERDYKLLEE